MTVIAWDGKTLAADRQITNIGYKSSCVKIKRSRGHLIFCAGESGISEALFDWFDKGADPAKFPDAQKTDKFEYLCAINPARQIIKFSHTPFPYIIRDRFYATGCGRDYAVAAMHLGHSAVQAVKVACKLDAFCGMGIDTLTLRKRSR